MSGPHDLKIVSRDGPYHLTREGVGWYYTGQEGLTVLVEVNGPDGMYLYMLKEDRQQEAQK